MTFDVALEPSLATRRLRVAGRTDVRADAWWVARLFFSIAAALTVVVSVAPRWFANRHAPARPTTTADWLLGNWLHWDSWWYVRIAQHGYTYSPHHMSAVAFFPTYPLIVRATSAVVPGGVGLNAILVTLASGCAALVLFHRWCIQRLTRPVARRAVIVMAAYPFAWFLYGAAYSDALFIALVIAAFLLVEADHPLAAGAIGAVATAARPTGITLVIGLVAVVADRHGLLGGQPRIRVPHRSWFVVTSVSGLVIWCTWLAVRFGNPFVFVETEGAPGWNQAPGVHTWLKLSLPHAVATVPPPEGVSILVQALAFAVFLACVPAVARRFGRGYAVYVAAAVLLPAIGTADFLGVGRYLLPAFPVFALAGAALQPRRAARLVVPAVSAAALVTGAALYASGYLIS